MAVRKYIFRSERGSLLTRFIGDSKLPLEVEKMARNGFKSYWTIHEYRKLGGAV